MADKTYIPVFIPGTNGEVREGALLGLARLVGNTLVVELKDTFPGVAIGRMASRGEVGITFFKIEEDIRKVEEEL